MPIRNRQDLLRRPPLAEVAYRFLMDGIVRGELVPGQQLNDKELSLALGMSRTPVREALKRLASMQIVEMVPNKYTRVASFNETETVERSNALYALYDLALCDGVPRLDSAAQQRLAGHAEQLRLAASRSDRVQITEASFDYFLELADSAGNDLLLDEMERVGVLATRALSPRDAPQRPLDAVVAGMLRVHESVAAGDAEQARVRLRELTALIRGGYQERVRQALAD